MASYGARYYGKSRRPEGSSKPKQDGEPTSRVHGRLVDQARKSGHAEAIINGKPVTVDMEDGKAITRVNGVQAPYNIQAFLGDRVY